MSLEVFVRSILLLSPILLSYSARRLAQEMEIPVAVQVPLFLKVMSFDRQLRARGEGEYVVAVAYQSGNRASVGSAMT